MAVIIYVTSDGGEFKIDELSQRLLVHFAIRGETSLEDSVGPVGAESQGEVIDRIESYLGPDAAGFVEITSRSQTFDGGTIDYYGLTDSGEDFIHNHIDDLAVPADLRDLSQRVSKLETELLNRTLADELRDKIDDLEYEVDSRISDLEDRLEDLESR
ncbi:hypothetical protein [Halosimplex halobium]|uniref:hypothetical protein n=1 Tax=Halosimplex halobium TaxID=3396618 RepID=UPI003F548E73